MKRFARLGIVGLLAALPLAQAVAYQVTVTPTSGLVTTEDGGTAQFTVVLDTAPTAVVTVGLSSSNSAEGTASTRQLVFTADNWNLPQTVTVTGVADEAGDGDQGYTIVTAPAVSDDTHFDAIDPPDVSLTNTDTSRPFVISAISGDTTEGGGTATFTVALGFAPSSDVVIPLRSSDGTEGSITLSHLTFTPADWNTAQTVTVTGVPDGVADGNQPYAIQLGSVGSGDPAFAGLNPDDVTVVNADADRLTVVASTISGPTTEQGGTATFTVVLTEAPTAPVVIPLSSSNTAEGSLAVNSITFTPADWDIPQSVTVTGVADDVADGDQNYTVVLGTVVSNDPTFNGIDPGDIAVTNAERAQARIIVSPVSGPTSEGGDQATFTVTLSLAPTADVVLTARSSDPGEGTVAPSMLIFSPSNWDQPRTLTITGALDLLDDGDQAYLVEFGAASSADPAYSGVSVSSVALINQDLQVLTDRVVGGEEQLDGLLLRGTVTNNGRLSNVRVLAGGTLEGGRLSGAVTNAGTVRNVTLDEGTSIDGGVVGGRISGNASVDGGASLINATVEAGAHLTDVVIGTGTQFEPGVILGSGVRFAANDLIPQGIDLAGQLDTLGGGAIHTQPLPDLSGDVVVAGQSGADPIILGLNNLPGIADGGMLVSQDLTTGHLRIGTSGGTHFVVRPTAVVQADPSAMGIGNDGAGIYFAVTADGRRVTLEPVLEDEAAFVGAAAAHWPNAPLAEGQGRLSITIDETRRLVMRPSVAVERTSGDLVDGVHWVEHPEFASLTVPAHVFTDGGGRQWEQMLYPVAGVGLREAIVAIPDIDRVTLGEDGRMWVYTSDGRELRGLLGIEMTAGEPSILGAIGFISSPDFNGDGIDDVTIVTGNGERQALYILP